MAKVDPEIQLYTKNLIDQTVKEFDAKLDAVLEKVENKYAIKLIEKIVFAAMGFIAITILGALLTQILI